MQKAYRALKESCQESIQAHDELASSLNSIKSLTGKPNRLNRSKSLKKIGTALVLAPMPEPFSDVIGLALIGAGIAADRHKPPLTICELCEEGRSILKGISSLKTL